MGQPAGTVLPDRFRFSIGMPIMAVVLGLPFSALFLWLVWDPSLLSGSDDWGLRWLYAQPEIVVRLFFLAVASVFFDQMLLAHLVPYLRSRTAVEFADQHLIVNGKYGRFRLPREAIFHVYRQSRGKIAIKVKDTYKQRSWYGWRVEPRIQTGNISGLNQDTFMQKYADWR